MLLEKIGLSKGKNEKKHGLLLIRIESTSEGQGGCKFVLRVCTA
jgi:hypothetical protein